MTGKPLDVLERAEQLAIECNLASELFPPREQDRLADQLRRAASSVALNIADGSTRLSYKDAQKFYGIARASLVEVKTILRVAHGSKYITTELYERLEALRDKVGAMLFGLMRTNARRIERKESRPI